jgi:hypothetical protein
MAIIENYNLVLQDSSSNVQKHYDPEWDNWVVNEKDIHRLVEYIRLEIKKRRKLIVTVFGPRVIS